MDRRILFVTFLLSSILCMYGAHRVNTWNGAIETKEVTIPGENSISGLIYKPKRIIEKVPGILLAHGISTSKELLSGLALELSKNGYVALSIDLVGHGKSSGNIMESELSLGLIQSAKYLSELDYVSGKIGLAGYSLGAGVSYYATSEVNEAGLVLIGGGIGPIALSQIDVLTSQPENVLVIIGRYDLLFNNKTIEKELEIVFTKNTPKLNTKRGLSEQGTLTMLLMPYTSHLFEPLNPDVIDATVGWFNEIYGLDHEYQHSYLFQEVFLIIGLIFFISAISLAPTLNKETSEKIEFNWRYGTVYSFIGFIIFLPSLLFGYFVSFPVQLFGSSIAWWLFFWGIISNLLFLYWRKEKIQFTINRKDLLLGTLIFFFSYLFSFGIKELFGFSYRLYIPIMIPINIRRAKTFFMYLPFMFVHFYSESNWFKGQIGSLLGYIYSKTLFFSALLFIQYMGFYLLDIILIGGYLGFTVDFFPILIIILAISSIISQWCTKNNMQETSIILNSLLYSWIAAGLFPF
jgi:dienelactone hydrolase